MVMLSPVCTPMASIFSIEQMMMRCPLVAHHLHLDSFQPQHGFLDQHFVGGEASIPDSTMAKNFPGWLAHRVAHASTWGDAGGIAYLDILRHRGIGMDSLATNEC